MHCDFGDSELLKEENTRSNGHFARQGVVNGAVGRRERVDNEVTVVITVGGAVIAEVGISCSMKAMEGSSKKSEAECRVKNCRKREVKDPGEVLAQL